MKKNSATDVTELLHMDHQKVRDLFFSFNETKKGAEKQQLVNEIITELYVHATVEEELVYPIIIKEGEEGKDQTDEADTEHRMVKYLMAELSNMKPSDEQYDAKVTVLCELVEHHVKEEEKEMFKTLRESGANLNAIGQKVLARKEELKGEALPSMKCSLTIGTEKQPLALPSAKKKVAKKSA